MTHTTAQKPKNKLQKQNTTYIVKDIAGKYSEKRKRTRKMFTGTLEELVKEHPSDTIEAEVFDLSEICYENHIRINLYCEEPFGDAEPDVPTVDVNLDMAWNLTHTEMWDIAETDEFRQALEKAFDNILQDRENSLGHSVTLDITAYEEPNLEEENLGVFEVSLNFIPWMPGRWTGWQNWDSEKTSDAMWDILATFINVTDPGTFGSPYIMNAVRENLSCG